MKRMRLILRCESTRLNVFGIGCSDQIHNSILLAGLPPSEDLVCTTTGTGSPSGSFVSCRSSGV